MSTPFNDQWTLDRTQHGGGGPTSAGQDEEPRLEREARPARRHEGLLAGRSRSELCKRPRWVDRDT